LGGEVEEAMSALKGEHHLFLLTDEYLLEDNRYFRLEKEKQAAFYHALHLIRGQKQLVILAWLWKWLL
jgi:hypothetical protein